MGKKIIILLITVCAAIVMPLDFYLGLKMGTDIKRIIKGSFSSKKDAKRILLSSLYLVFIISFMTLKAGYKIY